MNTKPIAILALLVTFIGSQFLPAHIYPYVLFPTLILLVFAIVRKAVLEREQGNFTIKKYMPMLIGIGVSIGIFLFYYFLRYLPG